MNTPTDFQVLKNLNAVVSQLNGAISDLNEIDSDDKLSHLAILIKPSNRGSNLSGIRNE